MGIIGRQHKAPGNLISYLNHGKKTDEVNALLNLCPDVYALLTPYIKIYRVDYKKDKTLVPYQETEIPFPTFIDPEDIKAMTGTDYGRFPGAGIKSFSWNLDGVNPAEVENNISANLVLHFQTVQDFFSLNTSLKLSKILNSHQNPLICESGIHSTDNIKFIIDNAGIYNFLIGESLLKSQDIGSKLKQFTQITL